MTISGFFGDEDALNFEIELIASNGEELPVDGVLDTGFTYWLAMDRQDITALGWTYLDQQIMYTARGDVRFQIYVGKVKFGSQEFDIPVHVSRNLSEVLIGRKWLETRRLVVDMPSGVLTLG
jgi:predicted aspartyl protease